MSAPDMQYKKLRVLLIDDQPDIRRLYGNALRDRGFQVISCDGVDLGMAKAYESGESLSGIVLDMMMPPGERYRFQDSQLGTRTGELAFAELRTQLPHVHIAILTNVIPDELLRLPRTDPCLVVLEKERYTPDKFAAQFISFLNQPLWWREKEFQLSGMMRTPVSGHGPGAMVVRPAVGSEALELLQRGVRADTPEPSIAPIANGGVRFDWKLGTTPDGPELCLEFLSVRQVHVHCVHQKRVIDRIIELTNYEARDEVVEYVAGVNPKQR